MRELNLIATGNLAWIDRPEPVLSTGVDAIVRPFVVGRCDGDALPIHSRVSRAMQLGMKLGALDPVVGHICGPIPFKGPFAIGHEAIAQVMQVGEGVRNIRVGDTVVVPWSISCGECANCRRGLTSKCTTARAEGDGVLAAYGFGAACGDFGGMVADRVRVPFADHMLVRVPVDLDPLRVAAASDNLADAWRTVVPHLKALPGARVLVIGGGAQSIGLYAAGLAKAHGASEVVYADGHAQRLAIAESLGAHVVERNRKDQRALGSFDITVEASSSTSGLRSAVRSTDAGGTCTAVGYYVRRNTGVPLMHMYANGVTLNVGISHPRPLLPELLDWMAGSDFAAERVATHVGHFDDAPKEYGAKAVKVVLTRERAA